MAVRNFVPWKYTDDNGVDWVRRADAYMTTQVADLPATGGVGGATAVGLNPYLKLDGKFKPRHVIAVEASTGVKARLVIYDNAAYIALVTGTTTLEWRDGGGTAHTGTVVDKAGEGAKGTIQR